MIAMLVKLGLPWLAKFILGRLGIPTALAPELVALLRKAKEFYDKAKASGATDDEAMEAASSVLSSYRPTGDDKLTEDRIKAGEPFNV